VQKTLHNSTASQAKNNIPDLKIWGHGDMWRLVCKASSKKEGWMKSTKAMPLKSGVIVQVTTQQGEQVAEALTFVPGAELIEHMGDDGKVVSREIV
jgi:hypothetical protein